MDGCLLLHHATMAKRIWMIFGNDNDGMDDKYGGMEDKYGGGG